MDKVKLFFLIFWVTFKRKWRKYAPFLILVSAFFFLSSRFHINPLDPNTLSEGINGTYKTTDLPEVATKLLSSGLVKMDENGKPIPDLVSGWEVNNDVTQFTFKLKPNLIWVDKTPVKSEDLEFNIPDVEVSYPDSATIQFKLKDSFSALPSILSKPVFKKGSTLVGVGPYQVEKIEKSVIFITKMTLSPEKPNLPNLALRFYPNEKTALNAFSLGEVQSVLGITNPNEFQDHAQALSLQKKDYSKMVVILYNFADPILGKTNRSLRQALSYGAPSVKGEIEAKTPIPPNSFAFTDQVNDYLDNYDNAKQALGRAKSQMKEEDLQKPIELTSTPQLADLAQEIANAWQGLGLKVVVRVESGIPQNFQALLITQTIPADPDQYSLWHSTQAKTNLTKYSSLRVDKDLEDGRKANSEEERKNKYFDFQRAILEDSPATFLYFPKYNVVYLKKVKEKIEKVLPLQL